MIDVLPFLPGATTMGQSMTTSRKSLVIHQMQAVSGFEIAHHKGAPEHANLHSCTDDVSVLTKNA